MTAPPVHHDMSACLRCMHGSVGLSGLAYCTARQMREFAHAMRQPSAPCGPSGFFFEPREGRK